MNFIFSCLELCLAWSNCMLQDCSDWLLATLGTFCSFHVKKRPWSKNIKMFSMSTIWTLLHTTGTNNKKDINPWTLSEHRVFLIILNLNTPLARPLSQHRDLPLVVRSWRKFPSIFFSMFFLENTLRVLEFSENHFTSEELLPPGFAGCAPEKLWDFLGEYCVDDEELGVLAVYEGLLIFYDHVRMIICSSIEISRYMSFLNDVLMNSFIFF